ncbi:PadR family transcriptional regulator [Herbiconiux sp. L3-i23]|uniref:PadR family transcriptional regulator n=1 Tax=Herbiconiux sp. L3-i23 TaxID=2905871 RepID=UPI002067AF11|nr:PadR family transcriptional regulator [Herbiconiux sp. L3-i23]BDI23267.1 PadR family transcriptional regulator [Herbiconiux sp. L3-i23]
MLDDQTVAGHLQELRRGTVVVACLAVLVTPGYGYGLLETLDRLGFTVDANTLYPLLRRLEKQGLLQSEWNTDESRPRKFYRTSDDGRELLRVLVSDWRALTASLDSLDEGLPS